MIGSLSETGTWIAKKLTTEHNSDNIQEVGKWRKGGYTFRIQGEIIFDDSEERRSFLSF